MVPPFRKGWLILKHSWDFHLTSSTFMTSMYDFIYGCTLNKWNFQRKRSKTPSDECDVPTSPSVARPVITLDQVKHKADEILEGRRNSLHSDSSEHLTIPPSQCDVDPSQCDENKFHLSVVDETLWQAAERTLTPMWEIATAGNDNVTSLDDSMTSSEPRRIVSPTYSSDGGSSFQHHDKVSGRKSKN